MATILTLSPSKRTKKGDQMRNPFYVDVFQRVGSKSDKLSKIKIGLDDPVYILCLKEGYNLKDVHLLKTSEYLTPKQYTRCKGSFVLVQGNYNLVPLHRHQIVEVSWYRVVQFNYNNLMNPTPDRAKSYPIKVIPMFNLVHKDVQLYLKLYTPDYSLDDLFRLTIMYLKYQKMVSTDVKPPIFEKLIYISNQVQGTYWERENQLLKHFNCTPYLDKPVSVSCQTYMDIFKGHQLGQPVSTTKVQVYELFQLIHNNDKMVYNYLNCFLLSKDHCHLVLNNREVLDIVRPTIRKNINLYRFLFSYGWLTMYLDHKKKGINTREDDRFIFSIETASRLPVFPFTFSDIFMNPYNTVLMSNSELGECSSFYCGIDMCYQTSGCRSLNGPAHETVDKLLSYSVSSLDSFQTKLNIFMTGNPTADVFKGLDKDPQGRWLGVAIAGPAVFLCARRTDMRIFRLYPKNTIYNYSETNMYTKLFDNYRCPYAVWVLCQGNSMFEFLDKVKHIVDTVENNLKTPLKINYTKSTVLKTTYKTVLELSKEAGGDTYPDTHDPKIKELFWWRYNKAKEEINRTHSSKRGVDKSPTTNTNTTNPLYEHYFKPVNFDMFDIKIVDSHTLNQTDGEPLFTIDESIVYTIISKNLKHPILIKYTEGQQFFSTVSAYEFPCFRGYYDGGDVKLTPEMVTAMMTNLNVDYYTHENSNPTPITNLIKVHKWGLGTALPGWLRTKLRDSSQSAHVSFGPVDVTNTIYNPDRTTSSNQVTINSMVRGQYICSKDELRKGYCDIFNQPNNNNITITASLGRNWDFDFTQTKFGPLKAINRHGGVVPIKKWILEAYWDTHNEDCDLLS